MYSTCTFICTIDWINNLLFITIHLPSVNVCWLESDTAIQFNRKETHKTEPEPETKANASDRVERYTESEWNARVCVCVCCRTEGEEERSVSEQESLLKINTVPTVVHWEVEEYKKCNCFLELTEGVRRKMGQLPLWGRWC